ncbi:glycoside hydrolase family 57 [Kordiimonas sp.]|uniref:glycoside hydrolase family 57 n=1 Tax=Kordiimonas sp. TaxID=1970157 RepID=UPI003A9090A1
MKPTLYTAFHLNLAFSSIEASQRADVVERCYWPLLRLAREGYPIGLEMTGFTLRVIRDLDPAWVDEARALSKAGLVEFIGSGYAQLIGPLVPPEVNEWNLKLGQADFGEILGETPKIALVNEQAYSPGLVPIYKAAGFEAIIMDWAEPASHHSNWKKEFALAPQTLLGADGETIPVIWSDVISFQKFQRFAHGELSAAEYMEFLVLQLSKGMRAMPLYTSDAEIFDFRPGRFESEATIDGMSEYERIGLLLRALKDSGGVKFGLPRDALKLLAADGEAIQLECASAPVPVKKQRKYNVLRWAVTGRNDLALNTHCWRIYQSLMDQGADEPEAWRELCGFWASDFRTHITETRWRELQDRLPSVGARSAESVPAKNTGNAAPPSIERRGRWLEIEAGDCHLALNTARGLAVQAMGFGPLVPQEAGAPGEASPIGTLAHGFYDDIAFGADFYSGHFVYEPHDSHKVTDLVKCEPTVAVNEHGQVDIRATIETSLGPITKQLLFDPADCSLTVEYLHDWLMPLPGAFRLGFVTLNPLAFDVKNLFFETHNGGRTIERHALSHDGALLSVDHGRAVSRLVSATTGLGMTGGLLRMGDHRHTVTLHMARGDAAGVGLITAQTVRDSYFVRAAISVRESDETSSRKALDMSENIEAPKLCYKVSLQRAGY